MLKNCLLGLLLLVGPISGAIGATTQLDLSASFNVDAWCGPLEMQAVYAYAAANDPDQDLEELQGDLPTNDVGWNIAGNRSLLVGASTQTGFGEAYSTSSQWFHPLYVSATEGTPEDGVLTGAGGREYHIASTSGNATLAGDWLEVADPGLAWDIQENAIVVGAYHRTEDWQISSVTIELPVAQKGKYTDVNFVMAAMDADDRARNMRIVALYGSTGADTEVLYSFSTADGGSGPMMDEQSGGTDFAIVHNITKGYDNDSGATGAVGTQNYSLYEFDTSLTLNSTKDLWGFRLEDTDPTLNNNARGLVVFAATATQNNVAPTADAGADQFVTDNDDTGSETVTLDGTGSTDSDGTIASYVWEENSTQIATGASPSVSLSIRMHEITLTVTDDDGATDSDTVNVRVYAKALPVRLDLSNGFNMDAWVGPLEMQAIYDYQEANDPDQDLMELQGEQADGVGWGALDGYYLLIGDTTAAGYGETYSISTNWFHPRYISGSEGTPEDGVITGGDGREYNLPSTGGNTTYAGNMLEVADPGLAWDTKPNVVMVGAARVITEWQISSATIELPAAQKASYTDVNFLLAANDASDRARNMRIVALYGSTGTDEEVLFSFDTADGGSGPMMSESTGDSNFDVAYTFTKSYANSNGATGAIESTGGSFYEFSTAITLNSNKTLWGFKIEDTDPTLTNNARGLTIFAASATSTSTMGVNAPPTADAGADQTVTDTDNNSTESISLDGSGSSDTDGDIDSWVWTENSTQIATGETPAAITLGVGVHDITLTVTDNENATDEDTVTVTINSSPGFKTYYVDYEGGSDTNNGLSSLTPWKHCPGDNNATDTAAAATLTYGDTVLFKGGVTYYGQITCEWSGSSGDPIVYDGNTAGTWGTGRAIIDGSEELTGWTQCQSAAEADGNPNYANIYWTYAPAGTTVFSTIFLEDGDRLYMAQDPNPTDPFFYDELDDFLLFDSHTNTTIVDADYFTQTDPNYWDGSTYVLIHGAANFMLHQAVTGYDPTNNEIQFEEQSQTWYTEYAMANSLKILDTAGELVVREDQTDANNRPKVYVWPLTTGVTGKTFEVAVEESCFYIYDCSYITIQGFKLTKTTEAEAAIRNASNGVLSNIVVDDNVMYHHGSTAVYLDDVSNCTVSNNDMRYLGDRGVAHVNGTNCTVEDNTIRTLLGTGIGFYPGTNCEISGNVIEEALGIHGNGITCYLGCDTVLIYGNTVSDGNVACTLQNSTDITVAYNVLRCSGDSYALADWGWMDGMYLYNNVIINGETLADPSSTNIIAKNNIMAGSQVQYAGGVSEYNIYTRLSWRQDPNNLGTGEFEATAANLWVDPDNFDFNLKSTSPAIDAGVNVGYTADIDGTAVPQGTAPDIGAYEY